MDSDRIWGGVLVALILFGWIVWMISKVVARIFHDLGIMFDAIGTASLSFLAMAWALAQLVAILGAGAAVVYAAYRHYQLTKQATEVLANVDARCNEWSDKIETNNKELEKSVSDEVWKLRRQLAAALAKPEAIPEQPKALPVPTQRSEVIEVTATQINESATISRVSNPY